MDINKLLAGVNCSCGKVHTCNIEYVYIEENAIERLRELCRENRSILLVADENTFAAAGEATVSALAGKDFQKVIFSGAEILVPNEAASIAFGDGAEARVRLVDCVGYMVPGVLGAGAAG